MARGRRSYGFICGRLNPTNKRIELLMVKKTCTYAYCDFIFARYKNNNNLQYLFNHMSHDEKMTILTMQFNRMWQRIYQEDPERSYLDIRKCPPQYVDLYLGKKKKFENNFRGPYANKLRRFINNSISTEPLWEFPKGHCNNNELNIEAAIREFSEETSIQSDQYSILFHKKPYVESYIDMGILYINTYYYAVATKIWDPVLYFNSAQSSEVSQIKWVCLDEIQYMQLDKNTKNRIIKLFKTASKPIRKQLK